MAITVGNKVLAYLSTLHTPAQYNGSSFITATIVANTAEELRIPFYCVQRTHSSGPEISVYRSTDGGANFETIAQPTIAISRATNQIDRKILVLEGGTYAFRMCSGGPDSATLGIQTIEVVTAYQGV